MFMLTGTASKRQLIDLDFVAENAVSRFNNTNCSSEQFLSALICFHSFTGCDSTSSFKGRGKKKPLKLLGSDSKYIEAFLNMSQEENLEEQDTNAIEDFVCHMYGKRMLMSRE